MPSGNPRGRPKKVKLPPPASFEQALERALARTVKARIDGVPVEMTQLEAMVEIMMDRFPRTTDNAMIRMLLMCMRSAPEMNQQTRALDYNAVPSVIEALRAEYEQEMSGLG